jgi:serine/threonine protein kinase
MGNVVVDIPSNTLKIADMGLAVCASHFVLDRPITPACYRAPEVFWGVKDLDYPQTSFDIWSFASMLSALLSGAHLFCVDIGASMLSGSDFDIKVLQKRIYLLGSPSESWPGITQLPKWSEYALRLELGVSADLPSKLVSQAVVRRPLGSADIDLLAGLFRWQPGTRLTADQTKSHKVWDLLAEPRAMTSSTHEESTCATPIQDKTVEMVLPETPAKQPERRLERPRENSAEGVAGVSAASLEQKGVQLHPRPPQSRSW